MLAAIVEAMQEGHETMKELTEEFAARDKGKTPTFMNHPGFVALMKKRLSTVFSAVEISSKASFLDEMEEKVSLTNLYQFIKDIVKYRFPLLHLEPVRRIKLLTLLEKLFLAQKHLSLDCLAAYLKMLLNMCTTEVITEISLVECISMFVYLSFHVISVEIAIPKTEVHAGRRQ